MLKQLLRQSFTVVLSFIVVILLFGVFRDRLIAATIEYRCVRWTWTGDVYNRKVVCLEWKKVEKK